jgi:hypothetical protein
MVREHFEDTDLIGYANVLESLHKGQTTGEIGLLQLPELVIGQVELSLEGAEDRSLFLHICS